MKILAFDTSSTALSVAILEDDQLLADTVLTIKKSHSSSLLPAIDFLMRSVHLSPQDLDRLVVAQGPGSYTGLRVAAATAKTLAYTLAIELVGVSSLQALVPADTVGLVIPIIDARRQYVYVGFYENGKAKQPDTYIALTDLLEKLKDIAQLTFVGEVEAFRSQIERHFPQAKIIETLPSAFEIGKLGRKLQPVDVHAFVPNYLKKVEAEENWLKTHKESGLSYVKRV
ncbi:tRNA (adenosine(37)-N6)-threonylcarbamoyltransferase complex dimerization subunit type 1 TsaB [Streptococcus macacae]|uniref:Universal bacterial protein YeaZ n=1 Tax=Streptococcus macacae NCTC 11558 TaxID=764298 RepID=G5JX61_9STRE|nr:tRNA (adenosine(37)-N6)-threonylcarbamoyltransferase complex dimerization subunit type 1 TsaB [Streptococcus macacae]EHJ52929.1 universal bacterial protein YeaZ [Streptococcus macacae NCTC 11558]SUN77834.1 glycoprotein endopeptidase [Streptococcus macacae NCTC 11558]